VRSYEVIESGRRRIIAQEGEPTLIEADPMSRWKEIQMNGNIRKMAVFVIVAAIAMITVVAMASAGDIQGRTSIQGQDYFIGAGPCLLAPGGFNSMLQPNTGKDGPWAMTDATWEGVYSFKPNGEGTFHAIYRVVDMPSLKWPPAAPGEEQPTLGSVPNAGAAEISWKFSYTLSEKGRITFQYETGTYSGIWSYGPQAGAPLYLKISGPYYGVLSPEGNNIVVTWGVPLQLMVTLDPTNQIDMFPILCNAVQQGFRCDGKCPELVY
jgi:hypothetical protein